MTRYVVKSISIYTYANYTSMYIHATLGFYPGVAMWLVPIQIQLFITLAFSGGAEEDSDFPCLFWMLPWCNCCSRRRPIKLNLYWYIHVYIHTYIYICIYISVNVYAYVYDCVNIYYVYSIPEIIVRGRTETRCKQILPETRRWASASAWFFSAALMVPLWTWRHAPSDLDEHPAVTKCKEDVSWINKDPVNSNAIWKICLHV